MINNLGGRPSLIDLPQKISAMIEKLPSSERSNPALWSAAMYGFARSPHIPEDVSISAVVMELFAAVARNRVIDPAKVPPKFPLAGIRPPFPNSGLVLTMTRLAERARKPEDRLVLQDMLRGLYARIGGTTATGEFEVAGVVRGMGLLQRSRKRVSLPQKQAGGSS